MEIIFTEQPTAHSLLLLFLRQIMYTFENILFEMTAEKWSVSLSFVKRVAALFSNGASFCDSWKQLKRSIQNSLPMPLSDTKLESYIPIVVFTRRWLDWLKPFAFHLNSCKQWATTIAKIMTSVWGGWWGCSLLLLLSDCICLLEKLDWRQKPPWHQ